MIYVRKMPDAKWRKSRDEYTIKFDKDNIDKIRNRFHARLMDQEKVFDEDKKKTEDKISWHCLFKAMACSNLSHKP
jgi:hypothetical protein